MLSPDTRTALVIAHPGHELRVFRWLEIVRPSVFVFTDGSGRTGRARLPTTTKILDEARASKGLFYGPLSDAAAYAAILDQDVELFAGLMRRLAGYLIDGKISCVVGDALEGYNPTHDVCRLVIGAAVEMAQHATGRTIENLGFSLTGKPDSPGIWGQDLAIKLDLDDDAFARKMAVAKSYPELQSEVDDAIKLNRLDAFRVECLHHVPNRPPVFAPDHKPYYEQYGEQQVVCGVYHQVIRYREHLKPLGEALWKRVEVDRSSKLQARDMKVVA